MQHGLEKVAAYRDPKGELHTFAAACPHLGCCVQWNKNEKSFDCPVRTSTLAFPLVYCLQCQSTPLVGGWAVCLCLSFSFSLSAPLPLSLFPPCLSPSPCSTQCQYPGMQCMKSFQTNLQVQQGDVIYLSQSLENTCAHQLVVICHPNSTVLDFSIARIIKKPPAMAHIRTSFEPSVLSKDMVCPVTLGT
jgi:hypothetical protein